MRTFAFLCLLGLAGADVSLSDQGDCLVDGAAAVSDLMDSAMYIWASIARCGHEGEDVKCEIAIASSIESVNAMINVILKAANKCHALDTHNKKCGLAASKLTRGLAGLGAGAGGLYQKCPGLFDRPHGNNLAHADPIFCTVNLKSTAKSLFKAIKKLLKINKHCDGKHSRSCASNALSLVGAFAGLGEYLAGALGHCTHSLDEDTLGCASHVSAIVKMLTKVSEGGIELSKECGGPEEVGPVAKAGGGVGGSKKGGKKTAKPTPAPELVEIEVPQKYEVDENEKKKDNDDSINAAQVLTMLLPVTAIVGFVGGRAFATHRERLTQLREIQSDGDRN